MLKNLKILLSKVEKEKDDQLAAVKLCEEYAIVDSTLVLALRAVAHSPEFRIKGALACNVAVSLTNVYEILRKFGINRNEKNELNRFVVFCDMKEIDLEFFKSEKISIEPEMTNCE